MDNLQNHIEVSKWEFVNANYQDGTRFTFVNDGM